MSCRATQQTRRRRAAKSQRISPVFELSDDERVLQTYASVGAHDEDPNEKLNQDSDQDGPPVDMLAMAGRCPEGQDGDDQASEADRTVGQRVVGSLRCRVRYGENYHRHDDGEYCHAPQTAQNILRRLGDGFAYFGDWLGDELGRNMESGEANRGEQPYEQRHQPVLVVLMEGKTCDPPAWPRHSQYRNRGMGIPELPRYQHPQQKMKDATPMRPASDCLPSFSQGAMLLWRLLNTHGLIRRGTPRGIRQQHSGLVLNTSLGGHGVSLGCGVARALRGAHRNVFNDNLVVCGPISNIFATTRGGRRHLAHGLTICLNPGIPTLAVSTTGFIHLICRPWSRTKIV